MSRTRRASANYGSFLLFALVSLAFGFVATPLLLHWLGEERYGAFRVTSDWYGYLNFLELGLGGALLPLLAKAIGSGEGHKVRDLLAAGMRAYSRIMAAMLLAGLLLASFITRLIPVRPEYAHDLRIGCLIGLAPLLWLPVSSPMRAESDARQRSYVINLLLVVQSVLVTAIALFLGWKRWGITGQFIAIACGGCVFNLVLLISGLRRYPGLLASAVRGRYDRAVTSEIWKLNAPTYVVDICGRISLLTDNIVVAAILGPAMVVPLVLTQRLPVLLQGHLQGIGGASWAGLAELFARDDREGFARSLLELTQVVSTLGVGVLAATFALNRYFVSLWVGPSRYGGDRMTFFAVANAFLLALLSLWSWTFTGTGQVRRILKPMLFQTVLNLVLSIFLTRPLGPVGPLIGTFAGFIAVMAWFLPFELRRTFGIGVAGLLATVLKPLAVGIPYAFLLRVIVRMWPPAAWWRLGLELPLFVLVYLAIAWLILFSDGEKQRWMQRVRLLFRPSVKGTEELAAAVGPEK
jgi:O-antigen/teichoic acid export membrane protein